MPDNLPSKETLTVEFKSDARKYGDAALFEDVVAFANTEGGDLYLGIEDDGTITGIHSDHSNPVTLSAYIANNTIPPLATCCELLGGDKPVLKISVPKFKGGIAATRSGKILRRRIKIDGTPENIPMYPTEIATRLSDLRLLDYSALPVLDGSLADLDTLEIERVRRTVLANDGDKSLLELDNTELLKALGFAREQNGTIYPTIAGILMVGQVPSLKRFVPTGTSSFQVLEGTFVRVNEDQALPILAAIEKIIGLAEAWNPETELEIGIYRMPAPEFDKRALREAVVNAFCHRDYSILGRVRVAIEDDGLTVANPGGFIEGVTIKNLLTAEPRGRNQLLSDALKRVGLAEKTGRGIDRIFAGSLIYGRPLPDYSKSTSTMVSVFIPRSKPNLQMANLIATEQRKIGRPLPIAMLLVLNLIERCPHLSERQIAEATNLSEAVVRTVLDRALDRGLAEVSASGKGRKYSLTQTIRPESREKKEPASSAVIDKNRILDLILHLAKSRKFIARSDVMQLLQVNEGKAYNLLKELVKQGKLKPVNKGRHAKYELNA